MSLRVYLLFSKYYREVVLLLRFSIQKFKEAEFFTRTDRFCRALSLRVYLLFCKYYREVVFNAFSIQKIQRGGIFLLELTQSLRVYLLFCKYYREEVFNEFSIQKIQRGRIFHSN
jgi:hypothetical protein